MPLDAGDTAGAGTQRSDYCSPSELEVFSVDFPIIDKCQIKSNGELVNSAQTLIAHIHNDINELRKM